MPRNALGHALGQNNIDNFELLRGFITIQGIVGGGVWEVRVQRLSRVRKMKSLWNAPSRARCRVERKPAR